MSFLNTETTGIKVKKLPRFDCNLKHHNFDCEDCGWYTDTECTLKGTGVQYQFDADGHMGGGSWDGQMRGVCLLILKRMGVELHMPEEYTGEATEPTPVNLDAMGIYDREACSHDGLVDLQVSSLETTEHGLSRITARWGHPPSDESEGELWFFLNDAQIPTMAFCTESDSSTAPPGCHVYNRWDGSMYEALLQLLQALGILRVTARYCSTV